MGVTIENQKRFVPISKYCEISGLSYATVNYLLKSNQLSYITTESGQRRVDTQPTNSGQEAVIAKLDRQDALLSALCAHLGVMDHKQSRPV